MSSATASSAAASTSVHQIVIVCENEARTTVVAKVARELDLPFVPFKILFVEGHMHADGGDASCGAKIEPVAMTPCFIAVGDLDNMHSIVQAINLDRQKSQNPFDSVLANPAFYDSEVVAVAESVDQQGSDKEALKGK